MDHQDFAADSRDMDTAQGASTSASGSGSGSGSGSRSSSPLPVEVHVQADDARSRDETASSSAQGVEAKRKKLFALFQKKNKGDPEASASEAGEAPAVPPAATTSKRPTRSRAAKTRQTTLVDLTGDLEDEEWAPSSVASSSRPKKKAKEAPPPPPPPRQRSPLPPLKLNVSGNGLADGQSAHSFFDRRPAGDTSRSGSAAPTKEKSSRPTTSAGRKKPAMHVPWPARDSVHVLPPEFPSRGSADAAAHRNLPFPKLDIKGKGKAASNGDQSLVFPSQGLAEEVRRRKRGLKPSPSDQYTNGSASQCLEDAIPDSLRDHSAFSGALERGKRHSGAEANIIWTDRWRPRRAEEVLGSEASARYLRGWLFELKLVSGTSLDPSSSNDAGKRAYGSSTSTPEPSLKRRKVQTSVEKLPKKGVRKGNGDASFIVDDDEDELYAFFENAGMRTSQHTDADVDDLGCGFGSGIDSQSSPEDAALDFRASDRLTNCILLHGPPGTGKTAAIFACADELNFEVFELFPGMGKRGSKELKEAVGALGRNHMVSGGGSGGGANRSNAASGSNAFKALMGSTNAKASGSSQAKSNQMRGRMVIPDSSETEDSQPIVEEEETTPAINSIRHGNSTRQSLILIEEADVLFEDDRAFWTGVVDLVKQSKRPVILTCNDLSYIPQDLLPIQQVLPFQQLDREAALHYLSFISEAEGRLMSREAIQQALDETQLVDGDQPAGHPHRQSDSKRPIDLRQAIYQLQFASSVSSKTQPLIQQHTAEANGKLLRTEVIAQPELADLGRLQDLSRGLSSLSFAHAELARPFVRQSADEEPSSGSLPPLPSSSAQGSSDQLNGGTSIGSSGSIGAPASSSDELLVPPSLRVLRAQENQKACPVALPLEGREDLLQQAVQESALAYIRSAFNDDESTRTAHCLTYDLDHSYAEDLHTQAEHLRCMLEPLLVPGLPLPPPHPSTRPSSSSESTLPIAPDRFWADYAPYVRLMVRIEDFEEVMRQYAQQQQEQESSSFPIGVGGPRSLRTSTRLSRAAAQAGSAGGERIIALGKEGLEAARKSASGFMQFLWAAPTPAAGAGAPAPALAPVPGSDTNGGESDTGGGERSLAAELELAAVQLPQVGHLPI